MFSGKCPVLLTHIQPVAFGEPFLQPQVSIDNLVSTSLLSGSVEKRPIRLDWKLRLNDTPNAIGCIISLSLSMYIYTHIGTPCEHSEDVLRKMSCAADMHSIPLLHSRSLYLSLSLFISLFIHTHRHTLRTLRRCFQGNGLCC